MRHQARYTVFCRLVETRPSWLPLPSLDEVVFQDVQAANHLGEDEDLVAAGLHLGQQLVDEDQFASRLHHSLEVEVHGGGTVHVPEVLQNLLLCSWGDKDMNMFSEVLRWWPALPSHHYCHLECDKDK